MDNHKEKLEAYLKIHNEFINIAERWASEFGYTGADPYDISMIFYGSTIEVHYNYDDRDSDGYPEQRHTTIDIPLSALWNDEAFELERKKRMEANLEAVAKKKEENAKRERLAKARRYEEYLDLQKEFNDNG